MKKTNFNAAFIAAFNCEDGQAMTELLSTEIPQSPSSPIPGPLGEFISLWSRFREVPDMQRDSLERLALCVRKFAEIVSLEDGEAAGLAVPFAALLRLFRKSAVLLDSDMTTAAKEVEVLATASADASSRFCRASIEVLREIFPRFHREKSKFAVTCLVASELCSLYLRLDQAKLAAPVLAAVEAVRGGQTLQGPLLVVAGRVALAQENFRAAEEYFEAAASCGGGVLMWLRWVKLLEAKVLKKDADTIMTGEYQAYLAFGRAVRVGNLALYESTLRANSGRLARLGVLSVAERLRALVERRLLEVVVRTTVCGSAVEGVRVDLTVVAEVWRWQTNCEKEEFFGRMVELVATGGVKGYLSWEHWKLVLSKVEPFPERWLW